MNDSFYDAYSANSKMVYWLAYSVTHDGDSAADIVQTTFLRAFENWPSLESRSEAQQRSWLYLTCRNESVNMIRKRRRTILFAEPPEKIEVECASLPEKQAESNAKLEWIWQKINALPAIYRKAVILHYFAELSTNEAAMLLNIPPVTYRSRLHRARKLLKAAMDDRWQWDE